MYFSCGSEERLKRRRTIQICKERNQYESFTFRKKLISNPYKYDTKEDHVNPQNSQKELGLCIKLSVSVVAVSGKVGKLGGRVVATSEPSGVLEQSLQINPISKSGDKAENA